MDQNKYLVTRNRDGLLKIWLPQATPEKDYEDGHWRSNNPLRSSSAFVLNLPNEMFPNVQFEDSMPTLVDIRKLSF